MKLLVLLFLVGCATANIHQGQEEEERGWNEEMEKVKQIIKNLGNDIKEKYTKFEGWLADTVKEGLEKGASGIDNIKAIAKEFIDNAENLGIDVVHEATEFFSKHKKDLGPLWRKIQKVASKIPRKG